jgi:hypothetical protein
MSDAAFPESLAWAERQCQTVSLCIARQLVR